MKRFRVVADNNILLETDSWDEAKTCQKEAHHKNPFLYHEIYAINGYFGSSQLEPGDDPETGRRKWCHSRITQEEANNGESSACLECDTKWKEGILIHCPWNYVMQISYNSIQKLMAKRT